MEYNQNYPEDLPRRMFAAVMIHLVVLVADGQTITGSPSHITTDLGSDVSMLWTTNASMTGSDLVIFRHNNIDFASMNLKRTLFGVYENSSFVGRIYHDKPYGNAYGFKINGVQMRDAGVYTCVYSNSDGWHTHETGISLSVYDKTLTYITEVVSAGVDLRNMGTDGPTDMSSVPTDMTLSATRTIMSAGKGTKVNIAVTVATGITSVAVTLVITGLALMFANRHKRRKQLLDAEILETLPPQTLEQRSDPKIRSTYCHSIYDQLRESKMASSLKDFHPELPPRDMTYSQPFENTRLDSPSLDISYGNGPVHNVPSGYQAKYVDMRGRDNTKELENKIQEDVYLTTKADVEYYNMGGDVTETKDHSTENVMHPDDVVDLNNGFEHYLTTQSKVFGEHNNV